MKQTYLLPHCVYILFSEKDHLLYIGYSSNLAQRVQCHNSGGTKSTSRRGPLKLIFAEYYLFKEDALKRESYFKTNMGKKAIKLMLRESLAKLNYKNPKMGILEWPEEELEFFN